MNQWNKADWFEKRSRLLDSMSENIENDRLTDQLDRVLTEVW